MEKIFNIISYQKNANQNHNDITTTHSLRCSKQRERANSAIMIATIKKTE